MINKQIPDELARKLMDALPDSIKFMQSDIENNIKAILQSTLNKMNLVSREEFDVQTALLAKTREKLNTLEEKIQKLETT